MWPTGISMYQMCSTDLCCPAAYYVTPTVCYQIATLISQPGTAAYRITSSWNSRKWRAHYLMRHGPPTPTHTPILMGQWLISDAMAPHSWVKFFRFDSQKDTIFFLVWFLWYPHQRDSSFSQQPFGHIYFDIKLWNSLVFRYLFCLFFYFWQWAMSGIRYLRLSK